MPESSLNVSRRKPVLGTYKRLSSEKLKQQLKKVAETTPTKYSEKLKFYNNKYPRIGGKKTKMKKSKSKRKRATKKQRK